ncbi:hypothetical protein [uncultured Duncaniella sp.]|uniref:hypothetical protein n=1 Tax=uncultured Duncaniella sp. TaxID=2768039 RepID=UPI0025B71A4A|nr:hypothetical protein [uncultured Duncaniella sp.]
MKKSFLFLTIVLTIWATVSGKVVRRQLSIFQNTVPETETLANETMEFVYDYRCCVDTTGLLDDNISSDKYAPSDRAGRTLEVLKLQEPHC